MIGTICTRIGWINLVVDPNTSRPFAERRAVRAKIEQEVEATRRVTFPLQPAASNDGRSTLSVPVMPVVNG